MLKNKNMRGFSLAELLIVIVIFSILMIVTGKIFINSISAALRAEATKEVRQNGDYAMRMMARRIRETGEVGVSCDQNNEQIIDVAGEEGVLYFLGAFEDPDGSGFNRIAIVKQNPDGSQENQFLTSTHTRIVMDAGIPRFAIDCSRYTSQRTIDITYTLEFVPFGNPNAIITRRIEEVVSMPFHTSITVRTQDKNTVID